MCVTNVYVDRYPDGRALEFRHTEICQYGAPGRPCAKLSTVENPVRHIQFGEPTTEYMIKQSHRRSLPQTPPRSAGSGSHHRRQSSSVSSEDKEGNIRRRSSKREAPTLRPTRTHRKERIIIVDSPHTPRTPPQPFIQTFSLPNSPATPPYIIDGLPLRERGRPIIVDERPLQREREILRETTSHRPSSSHRVPSVGAVIGSRRRLSTSRDRERFGWDSPSSSHTSFDSRMRREVEEIERRKRERDDLELDRVNREIKDIERKEREREDRIKALEAEKRREDRIRMQDEEIRRRPVVPVPPNPLGRRGILKSTPVEIVGAGVEARMSGGLGLDGRGLSVGERALAEEKEIRRRLEERDREVQERMRQQEDEALKERLRERQMPKRSFSVGPGNRRHRVLYDDGVYRWE